MCKTVDTELLAPAEIFPHLDSYSHNKLIPFIIFVQVNSGFLHEDDMRIVIRQIRDRVMQVKRERERRVEMGSQQSVNSANDSNSSTVQPQGANATAVQQQVNKKKKKSQHTT